MVTFELIRYPSSTHSSRSRLFLLGGLLVSLVLSTLLALTDETGLGADVTELPVRVLGGLVVGNLALLELDDVLDGQGREGRLDNVLARLGGLDVLGRSITLLRLAVAAREEDELALVLLEALHVGLEALLGKVLATGVDGDTDGTGELAGNASSCRELVLHEVRRPGAVTLQLNEREATTRTNAAVV
jgi:hypothetical protein